MTDNRDVFPLVISGSNVVRDTNNSRYRLNFPQPVNFRNSSVAVGSVSMYYSWFNVNASTYNNNVFQIIHPNGAGFTTLTITLPNGFYSVSDINSYIQQQLIANNFYLIDNNGNYVYYIQLVENGTYYSIEQDSFPVPISLPTGWTNPGLSLPAVATTPQLVIPSNNNFGRLIGFNAGTTPSPVQSVVLTCNLLQNKYMSPQNVLYSFTSSGSQFGTLIERAPNFEQYVAVADGDYSSIEIQFLSQDYLPLPINDPNITIILLIKI